MPGTDLRTRIGTPLAILLFLAICWHFRSDNLLVDAHAYSRALNTCYHGGDPYLEDARLRFVYPPWFLLVPYIGKVGWYLYLVVNVGSLLSIPYLISRYLQGTWATTTWCYLVFALMPTLPGEESMMGGTWQTSCTRLSCCLDCEVFDLPGGWPITSPYSSLRR